MGRASIRKFPYPYRAALAICSDIDQTEDTAEFLAIQRFLNTESMTPMGPGVGLEIGNSFFFYDKRKKFSYFDSDERAQGVIQDLIRAGYIDCLHSFGDTESRDDAARALDTLDQAGCHLDVWVNHFGAPSDLATKFGYLMRRCNGAVPDSSIYHADLSIQYGIKFAWVGAVTRMIGQECPNEGAMASLGTVFDPDNAVSMGLNVVKEAGKTLIGRGLPGRGADSRYHLQSLNLLSEPLLLEDGNRLHEFLRYCNHPISVSVGATSRGLAYAISKRALDILKKRRGYSILYTHLGKNSDCDSVVDKGPIAKETQEALRNLALENKQGQIYVTTTSKLLNYYLATKYLVWSQKSQEDKTLIEIAGLDDPIFGLSSPRQDQLQGLSFYIPDQSLAEVSLGGKPVEGLERNPPDEAGRASVSIPLSRLQFPL